MAFDFQAYRNPYVSTIADLLSRGEDAKAKALVDVANAQARAAEIRGQAYGGAIESVGKIVSGIPAQIQAGKDQAFKTAQQARLVQQQKLEDAAQARQEQARVKFSEFQANPNVTTVTPGQAGSLPDRMLPSLAPKTFVPDAQAPVGGTIGGFLNRANVFGGSLSNALPQDVPDARADMIPSVSMSGNAAPAPRLTPTLSVPETTNVTNTSKRMSVGDVNGLDLWDIDAYAKQMAAAGLSAEAQPSLALMRASNDDMEKHHASALAVARNDAARILKFADSQIPSAVDQLVEKYSNNGVFPTYQLEMVKQQIGAIKQLPQDQQLLAYKKLVQSVGDVTPKLVSLGVDQKLVDADTNEVVANNPKPPEDPKLYQVTVAGPDGKPEVKLFTEAQILAGVPVYRERKTPSAGNLRFLTGPNGDVIEWSTTTPAPKGYKPYDAVAERGSGAQDGQYSAERERRVLSSIDELLPKVGEFTTGYGSLLSSVPRSDARAFAAELATLKANIAFNELAAMRAASKTGGALGNISNVELQLLESTLGALDAGQSPAQVTAQLNKIKDSIVRWQTARNLQPQAGDKEVRIVNPGGSSDADADAAIARANAARVARERK